MTDALDPETRKQQLARLKRAAGGKVLVLSAASGEGVQEALRAIQVQLDAGAAAEAEEAEPAAPWQP